MGTLAERILDAIRDGPLDDDVLAQRLGVSQRQSVNQTARRLESQGRLRRYRGAAGKTLNAALDGHPPATNAISVQPTRIKSSLLAEDQVKRAVSDHLQVEGFDVTVAWGRTRGIDIDALHSDGRRFVIEAKGEVALQPQQVNYFLGALGELVQRMNDPNATYGLALPANKQYRGLVARLPDLARRRLNLVIFWVHPRADGFEVEVDG